MVYTKNYDPWTTSDIITSTVMNNFETIYSEANTVLTSHSHSDYYSKSEMDSTFWKVAVEGSGTGSDADLIYKSTGNLHASDLYGLGVNTGLIVLWYGSILSIPSGWNLCDGSNGTVNLQNKFIVGGGTGSEYVVGETGGSTTFTVAGTVSIDSHILSTSEMGQHRHPFKDMYGNLTSYGDRITPGVAGAYYTNNITTSNAGSGSGHTHTAGEGTSFSGNAIDSMPYFMALCYIQKI